jgi:RND family efflux transporter MFP subunit
MKVREWLGVAALTVGPVVGCRSSEPAHFAAIESVQARIVESTQVQIPVTVQAAGTLHAHQSSTLSAQVMGRVQQVLVREGDFVRAGQTLAVLDDATLRSAYDQSDATVKAQEEQQAAAESNSELATSTLARYRQLQAQKSVSPQEMDEVTRRAEAAQAQLEAMRAETEAMKSQRRGAGVMLSYSKIVAPFPGVITGRMVDPGALASPGAPLLQIDSSGPFELDASVAESAIASVHPGMRIAVSTDRSTADSSGTVAEIVPAADPSSHSFLVKINLPPSKALRAGMYATAEIPTGMKQAIIVPRSAVVIRGSLACAYVLDGNNLAQLRYVTLGATREDQVEIFSGMAGNERLVDNPADRDLAGKRIEVLP